MPISTATFVKDTILYIRDSIASSITDPISSSRSGRERFVMTEYPQRDVKYPVITIKALDVADVRPLGHASEGKQVTQVLEIRVWSRNVSERDDLVQKIHVALNQIQLDATTGSNAFGLFSYRLLSANPIDEPGDAGIHSTSMTISYFAFVNG